MTWLISRGARKSDLRRRETFGGSAGVPDGLVAGAAADDRALRVRNTFGARGTEAASDAAAFDGSPALPSAVPTLRRRLKTTVAWRGAEKSDASVSASSPEAGPLFRSRDGVRSK